MSSNFGYCKVSISPVRSEARDASEMVTQLFFGEVVEILEQEEKWWQIRTYNDNYLGWVDPKQIRKLTKKEVNRWLDGISYQYNLIQEIQTPWGKQQIFKGSFLPYGVKESFSIGNDEFALIGDPEFYNQSDILSVVKTYLNAPYLWGGKTPFGIDCSGLTQMVFRFLDINLPRDASQQVDFGTAIEFEDRLPGDVLFFKNQDDRIIHVGIALNQEEIIHASGQVRIDSYDQHGIIHFSREYHTHKLHSIKRM